MARRRCLSLERLEDRTAPAVWYQPWPMPAHITLSFAPDGTTINGQVSDLFQTLNAIEPTASWQRTILEAVQAWTSQANLNVGLVADDGAPFGTPGSFQGDPRFGDIRIGAETLGPDTAAIGSPPDPYQSGTWGGDIVLNDSEIAGATDAELYTVVLHELGHSFGLPDNNDPSSVMSISGQPQLAPEDVTALQALYGPPAPSPGAGESIATAMPIPTPGDFNGSTPIVAYGAINSAQPTAVYSFSPPTGYKGTITVWLVTSGISLLDPAVTVSDSSGNLSASGMSTALGGDAISVGLGQAGPSSTTYYVSVSAAMSNSFNSGRFGLAVSFNAALQVPSSLIDTVLRAPGEGLTADQIEQLFLDPQGAVDVGGGDSATQLDTALALATTPGFAPDTRYAVVDSLSAMMAPVYYEIQAPATSGSKPLVLTAGLNAAGSGGDSGSLELLDSTGKPLAATVLLDADGMYTIQAMGLTPGATYYLSVSPPAGASKSGGYSILVADFLQTTDIESTFETMTFSNAVRPAASTLYVAQTQVFQFQLSALATNSGTSGEVEMIIFNQNGNAVFDTTAMAGLAGTVSYVMLPPGQYLVEFSLIGVSGDARSSFTYTIQGAAISDPIGPIVHDPTYTPIYLGPPGPITTYRYPNGTISTIPYLWVSL